MHSAELGWMDAQHAAEAVLSGALGGIEDHCFIAEVDARGLEWSAEMRRYRGAYALRANRMNGGGTRLATKLGGKIHCAQSKPGYRRVSGYAIGRATRR